MQDQAQCLPSVCLVATPVLAALISCPVRGYLCPVCRLQDVSTRTNWDAYAASLRSELGT